MNIEIPVHLITIKDEKTGEEKTIKTLKTAVEIANYIEETEREDIAMRVEEAVGKALAEKK